MHREVLNELGTVDLESKNVRYEFIAAENIYESTKKI